jgi:hypothetical protein
MPIVGESETGGHLSPNIVVNYNVGVTTECSFFNASTRHPAGIPVCLGDGSGRIISSSVTQLLFNLLMVPNDGVALSNADW